MNRGSRQTWRQVASLVVMLASMTVGIIFGYWENNPFDPYNYLFAKNPPNNFLWISTIAFFIAAVLPYTIWPLVRAEAARKDIAIDPEKPSPWYRNKSIVQANRMVYLIFMPGISIMQILRNLGTLSNLEIFGWLSLVALLVVIITDIVALVLLFKGYRQRARERAIR